MASIPTPKTCANISIAGGTWPDVIAGLRDYFQGSATEWSLKNDGVDGSGDEGITIAPESSEWAFDANFRYVSSSGRPYAQCDPGGGIADPNNPVSSGVSTSPNGSYTGPSSPSIAPKILVAEWPDAVAVLFKDPNESYIDGIWGVGRFISPAFASDPARNLDGLTTTGYRHEKGGTYRWFNDTNGNSSAYTRTPDGWKKTGAANPWGGAPDKWSNSDTPFVEPVHGSRRDFNNYTPLGDSRYLYQYHTSKGSDGIPVIKNGDGDAFIFLNHKQESTSRCIAWDGNVSPV